jgi:hypothetical protein
LAACSSFAFSSALKRRVRLASLVMAERISRKTTLGNVSGL